MNKRVSWVCVFLFALVPALLRAELADGLVLYLPLDEGSGNTVKDYSGQGNDGTIEGSPEWVDGKFGKALRFKTSADKVAVEPSASLELSGEMSMAAWINLDRLPGAHSIIIGTRNDGAPGRKIGFGFGMDPQNNIKVWTNNDGGGFLDVDDTKTRLEPNRWYYIAATHTSDKGTVRIYVDGQLTHEQDSNNPVNPWGAPAPIYVGGWSGEAWPGIVDEARVWNRLLSDAEVKESMDAGLDKILAVDSAGKLPLTWGRLKRRSR